MASVRCNKNQTWETLEEVAVTVTGKIWQISHSHNFAPGWRRGGGGAERGVTVCRTAELWSTDAFNAYQEYELTSGPQDSTV